MGLRGTGLFLETVVCMPSYKPCRKDVQYKESIYKKIVGVVGAGIVWIEGLCTVLHTGASEFFASAVYKIGDKAYSGFETKDIGGSV